MGENPRGRYGRIVYDLEADFGVKPEALRKRFQFYFDRFAVRVERPAGSSLGRGGREYMGERS